MADSLEQLLRDADAAAAGVDRPAGELAARVRGLARRRKRQRAAGLGAMAVMGLALAGVLLPREELPVAKKEPVTPAASDVELAAMTEALEQIRAEAESRERMVALMLDAESRKAPRTVDAVVDWALLDPAEEILLERDRAASIMVHSADRMSRHAASREAAMEDYRRVVQLFPATHSAEQARRRLGELAS